MRPTTAPNKKMEKNSVKAMAPLEHEPFFAFSDIFSVLFIKYFGQSEKFFK